VLAVYSSSNGLAAAVLVAVTAFVLPVGWAARIVLAVTAVLSIASFFVGYRLPADPTGDRIALDSWQGVLQLLDYVNAFLGSIGQYSARVWPVLGIVGLAVWAAVALALLLRFRAGCPLDPSAIALFMLATLAIATAVMAGIGRGGHGSQQALSPRYATWSILFWAGLAGAAWRVADAAGHPPLKLATLGVTGWLLALSYPSGRYQADYARRSAAMIDVATAELRAGQQITAPNRGVHPDVDRIRPLIEFLRARRLSVFAD
jgi:hypothetical protein